MGGLRWAYDSVFTLYDCHAEANTPYYDVGIASDSTSSHGTSARRLKVTLSKSDTGEFVLSLGREFAS